MSMRDYDMVTLRGTTDGSGDATVDSAMPVTGEIMHVQVEGAALTDSANLVLSALLTEVAGTTEVSALLFINHADIGNAAIDQVTPRMFAQLNTGADMEVVAGQKTPVPYFVPGAKLRAVVSAGGDTKAFCIKVWVR